jgi:phospholipid/cholesterol/gamma-HCH transport system substrate-binding protein
MLQRRSIEIAVGFFMILSFLALTMLALQVSGLNQMDSSDGYYLKARFDQIGGVKARSRVSLAGVQIGRVTDVKIDPKTYQAVVTMHISSKDTKLPKDSSASILTAGLLGDSYIALEPGAEDDMLKNGDEVEFGNSAMILERLIGQYLFNKDKDKK